MDAEEKKEAYDPQDGIDQGAAGTPDGYQTGGGQAGGGQPEPAAPGEGSPAPSDDPEGAGQQEQGAEGPVPGEGLGNASEPLTQAAAEDGREQAPDPAGKTAEPERTFTQAEVNELIGRTRTEARERARKETLAELLDKYGFEDASQFDEAVGNGEKYDELSGQQSGMEQEMQSLRDENILLRSGIDPDRFNDVKAVFAYRNEPITPEALELAIDTHPEWVAYGDVKDDDGDPDTPPASVVKRLGAEPRKEAPANGTEEEQAAKLFGWNAK